MSSPTEHLPSALTGAETGALRLAQSHPSIARRAAWCPELWQAAAFTALIGTAAFFLPLVAAFNPGVAKWPAFILTGDQRMVYFPSFVEGYRRFWHGGLLGLDFLTGDGASIFAYRPNLMPFYPPYLLAYFIVDCSDLAKGALAYVTITMAHQFVGIYFTIIFFKRYLALPLGAAILGAVIYTINQYVSNYTGEATFYFQAMAIPGLACALCWLAQTRSNLAPIWMAPVFVCYALSNYGPMMLAGLAFAIVAAGISLAVLPGPVSKSLPRNLVGPAISLGLAALSTAAYFGAQLHYKHLLTSTGDDIDSVAHSMALSGYDLLNAVSQFLDLRRTRFEALLVWGAIPTFLALIGLHVVTLHKAEVAPRHLRTAGAAALVYLLTLIPIFGHSLLPAADLFYYAVPVLGKMHIYQRFLLFSQFFFAIAVAALTTITLVHATPRIRIATAYTGIAVWLAVTVYCLVWPPTGLTNTNGLLLECFLVAVTGIMVAVSSPEPAFLLIAVLAGLVGASSFFTLPPALNTRTQWEREPDPLGPQTAAIVDFFRAHSKGHALSKFVIASPDIEPFFNRNLPWQIGSQVKTMNFQGYPGHLSVLADYAVWVNYGAFDLSWLKATGISFVLWSDATGGPLGQLLNNGFKLGAILTLPGGHHVAEIRAPEPAAEPDAEVTVFDNGIFRLSGAGSVVTNFETDYTRKMRLDIEGTHNSIVTYLLWPNPYMKPSVDGRPVAWRNPGERPLRLEVGPGRHAVEVMFVSRAGRLFLLSQLVLAVLAGTALALDLLRNRLPNLLHGRFRSRA